jgi:hypothetical protein
MVRKAYSASDLLRGFCALIVLLGSLLAAPDASAQCSAISDTSDSNVRFSSCTTLTFNVSIPPLTIVADSVTAPAGTENPLEAGDTSIEKGVTENFTITLSGGRTGDTNIMSSGSDTDRPFSASAPIGGAVGSAIVELDLGYSSSTDPVDFLTYDWRGGSSSTDPYEQEIPDGANYTDNPRAIIEFGSYRSHDRVLSWRELYVMPAE